MNYHNSYTKLRDDTWGVRSTNPKMVKGREATVTVLRKNGDTSVEEVKCFWHGTDRDGIHVALCQITTPNDDIPNQPHSHDSNYSDFVN